MGQDKKLRVVGHQGARGLAPENTMASLLKGLECGADEVEFDVRVTKDNIPILSHDTALELRSDNPYFIHEHTFKELKAIKKDLATLEEVIRTLGPRIPLLIEIKPGQPAKPIIAVIRKALRHKVPTENLILESYDYDLLKELHAALPSLPTAVVEDWLSFRARKRAKELNTTRIHMLEYWLWPGFIEAMTKEGYQLYSYSPTNVKKERLMALLGRTGKISNPAKAQKWIDAGLAGVITDFPDRYQN